MKVVFRVDAALDIGTGHVMRCLALAEKLRFVGAECHFICRAHAGNSIKAIGERGFEVTELPLVSGDNPREGRADNPEMVHAAWLGAEWRQDAEQTLCAVRSLKPDLLVIDHYAIDWRWEGLMRPQVHRIMVIDDLADRRHDCDFLLDQNWFGESGPLRYQGLVPLDCVALLGPAYALLKPEYATLRALIPSRDGEVRRLLVFLGGSDPANETGKVMDALTHPGLDHLVVDVVLGINHPDPGSIASKAEARPATYLHSGLPSLAGLMARADLMISAGGSTSWERMCLGLPAIVISIAENQTATSKAMMEAGYIDFLGDRSEVDVQMIVSAVLRCLAEPSRLQRMSRESQELVSGAGVERVCGIVLG
tara:strand:+ start:10814 stop:11911 length:1098 start_codon:yes stop_codon:yes gene_type:complete